MVARQVLEFPRWRDGMLERLMGFFDGQRFREVVQMGRRSAAQGTPIRSPARGGRPFLRERLEQVGLAPFPCRCGLIQTPSREPGQAPAGGARSICRRVDWCGWAVLSARQGRGQGGRSRFWLRPIQVPPGTPELQKLAVPLSVLSLLSIGRVLRRAMCLA